MFLPFLQHFSSFSSSHPRPSQVLRKAARRASSPPSTARAAPAGFIGGVDYVTKPFNPLELAPLVRELLDRIEKGERDELRGEKLAELRGLMDSE